MSVSLYRIYRRAPVPHGLHVSIQLWTSEVLWGTHSTHRLSPQTGGFVVSRLHLQARYFSLK